MEDYKPTSQELIEENRELRDRLWEAEVTLRAIQSGEVDALVVERPEGTRLYTLTGADHGYRVLVESITEGALILSSDDSVYYCNRTLGEMLGLPIQQIISRKFDPYFAPECRSELLELVKESRTAGVAKGEFLMRRTDGTLLPVNVSLNSLHVEDFHGVCAVITGLSEQKRIEEELRRHRTELELLVKERTADLQREIIEHENSEFHLAQSQQLAHLGSWSWEIAEDRLYWSDETYRILGAQPQEFVPRNEDFLSAVHPEDRDRVEKSIRDALVNGRYTPEFRIINRGGDIRYVHSVGKTTFDKDGNPVSMEGYLQDITERKQMEEELRKSRDELEIRVQERTAELIVTITKLEQLNQELQEFAFIASHDLQEPLRKIQTFGNMLIRKHKECLNPEGQDYMRRIIKGANRMSELLRALLIYSRSGTSRLSYKPVSLTEIARDAASDLEHLIKKAQGSVEIGELPTVEADPLLLRQVFQNIIGNAIKYRAETAAPLVKIYGGTDGDFCRVFIEDNGIGFDECYYGQIFKPFQRLHGKSSPYSGTGMGLAICRKIVARHGGDITVKSAPGEGTTFIVTLPLQQGNGD